MIYVDQNTPTIGPEICPHYLEGRQKAMRDIQISELRAQLRTARRQFEQFANATLEFLEDREDASTVDGEMEGNEEMLLANDLRRMLVSAGLGHVVDGVA